MPTPDPEVVNILVDRLGAIVRAHVKVANARRDSSPGAVVDAAKEALNALASVAALTVSGLPSSAGAFDFFLAAFRGQIAANIEHKINPQPRT